MSIVYITTYTDLSKISWYCFDKYQKITDRQENQSPNYFPKQYASKLFNVVIILLGTDITCKKLNVPNKMSSTKLKLLAPNLIEDDLLSEQETLYFTCIDRGKGTSQICAIVGKKKYEALWNKLSEFNIIPNYIVPASSLMPMNDAYHVARIDNYYYLNTPNCYGMVCNAENLSTILSLSKKDDNQKQYFYYTLDEESIDDTIDSYVKNNNLQSNIKLLLEQFDPEKLLQFNIKKAGLSKNEQKNRPSLIVHTLIIMTLFACIQISIKAYEMMQLSQQETTLTQKTKQKYFELFPNAQTMVDPRLRIQQIIHNQPDTKKDQFIHILSKIDHAFSSHSNIIAQTLYYNNGIFTVTVVSNNYQQIEVLLRDFGKKGFLVEVKSSKMKEQQLITNLTIEH